MSFTEEELIRARPLLFENRPYVRLGKRSNALHPPCTHSDIDLDFDSFSTTLTRLQLLSQTNAHEISRYTSSASQISALSERARSTLLSLRSALDDAQIQKRYRLEYDVIAESIPSSLRPREETMKAIDRLQGEIEELERERGEYEKVWKLRGEAFGGVVEQLQVMWAQIKEEKEEHDRREGMSEEEDVAAGEEAAGVEEGEVTVESEVEVGEVGTPRGQAERGPDRMDTT